MTPKQVFDAAQAAGMDLSYAAIRKLLRGMLRGYLRCDRGRYSLITGLNQKQIAAAPRWEFYHEETALIKRHRRQRHTTASDFIWGLEKCLREERATLAKVRAKRKSKSN